MENVANSLDKEHQKEKAILKEVSGLGTPATRAGMIELLISREFIKREGKSLVSTELGRQLIESLPDKTLKTPLTTARWEEALKAIEEGRLKKDDFMESLVDKVKETVRLIKKASIVIPASQQKSLGTCPQCKQGKLLKFKQFIGCSNRENCSFTCSTMIAGKEVTDAQFIQLFQSGSTQIMSGFRSKKGEKFSAKLVLKEGKIELDFSKSSKSKGKTSKKKS